LNTTNSSSWESQGPYQLEMASYLFNYSDPKWGTNFSLPPRGDYGLATLGLTRLPSALTLNKQVVATFEAVGFYLGFFGLASDDIDFGDGIRHPSYLTTLYNKSMIPSTSWGYQAGAAYRKSPPAPYISHYISPNQVAQVEPPPLSSGVTTRAVLNQIVRPLTSRLSRRKRSKHL